MSLALPSAFSGVRYPLPYLREDPLTHLASRNDLYATLEAFYWNDIFERLGLATLDSELAKNAATAYVRGIYNPVSAIVDAYVEYTLQGTLGPDTDPRSEVHIRSTVDNPNVPAAVEKLWRWSSMETDKVLIPYYAANLGDALLSVVARPANGLAEPAKVWVEVRHPGVIREIRFDDRGNIVFAVLEEIRPAPVSITSMINRFSGQMGDVERDQTVTAIYTKDEFAILVDGELERRWPNHWGFVPLVLIRQKYRGGDWGLNAYHSSIPDINELCFDASVVGQILGQWLAPQWAIFGVGRQQTIKRDGSVWLFDADAKAQALTADSDIAGAYQHMKEIMSWVYDRQPELALARARAANLESGEAIRAMLFDLIVKFKAAQGNYDTGLVRAFTMGLTMAQDLDGLGNSVPGFAGIGSYEAGELGFVFERPEILPVSQVEAMRQESEIATLERQTAVQRAVGNAQVETLNGTSSNDAAALLASRLLTQAGGS